MQACATEGVRPGGMALTFLQRKSIFNLHDSYVNFASFLIQISLK